MSISRHSVVNNGERSLDRVATDLAPASGRLMARKVYLFFAKHPHYYCIDYSWYSETGCTANFQPVTCIPTV